MSKCNRCEKFTYSFDRLYHPEEYIEGYPESEVWIIGLNPAHDKDYKDESTAAQVQSSLIEIKHTHKYFRDFRGVSRNLFDAIGKPSGVAHTDIVKCFGKSFPKGIAGRVMTENCWDYLENQILKHQPKMLICNGARVSDYIVNLLPRPIGSSPDDTSYIHSSEEYTVCVVLSGFIGRIDRYARRRLGREIEQRMGEQGIQIETKNSYNA